MSQELQNQVDALVSENNNLKNQANQNSMGVNTLLAQIDAHKQTLNETMQVGMNLRTNCILLDKQAKELKDLLLEANNKCDAANKKVEEANKRIAELELQQGLV